MRRQPLRVIELAGVVREAERSGYPALVFRLVEQVRQPDRAPVNENGIKLIALFVQASNIGRQLHEELSFARHPIRLSHLSPLLLYRRGLKTSRAPFAQ